MLNHITLKLHHIFFFLALACSSLTVSANEKVAMGDALALAKLQDQFDKEHELLSTTKWLLFSHDMSSSKVVQAAFEKQTSASLSAANIQYYADISAMPGLVSRFLAIPKMKKLNYAIVLDRKGKVLNNIPKKEDMVTLLNLEKGKVISVAFVQDSEKLKNTLFK